MRVLITGAAGFIGSHVAERLQTDGHDVTGVDNLETGRRENWSDSLGVCFEEDIVDRDVLYRIANHLRPELIVHAAASYSNPDFWHRDTDTNVAGTINVAITAKHHDAKVIYFQTALPPISSYAISKIAGEHYLKLASVPLTVFRLANAYGPRNMSGPIPTFYKRLTEQKVCTVVDTARDMVYIDDLVDAVMIAIDQDVKGKFDICSGQHVPIETLYNEVARQARVYTLAKRASAGADDVKQMKLDPEPAREALGWTPRVSLAAGIAAAVDWYRENSVSETYTHLVAR